MCFFGLDPVLLTDGSIVDLYYVILE